MQIICDNTKILKACLADDIRICYLITGRRQPESEAGHKYGIT